MSNRFDRDRKLGYRDEAVSSMEGHHRDDMAEAAEEWLAGGLGEAARSLTKQKGRDPGWDMVFHGWRIDVKWTPYEPGDRIGYKRDPAYPHLIVPTWKPRRADIYVLVIGSTVERFDLFDWASGWETRDVVEQAKVVDWGRARKTSGRAAPVFAIGFDYLRPLGDLDRDTLGVAPR